MNFQMLRTIISFGRAPSNPKFLVEYLKLERQEQWLIYVCVSKMKVSQKRGFQIHLLI
jgi:hypothetical protein